MEIGARSLKNPPPRHGGAPPLEKGDERREKTMTDIASKAGSHSDPFGTIENVDNYPVRGYIFVA